MDLHPPHSTAPQGWSVGQQPEPWQPEPEPRRARTQFEHAVCEHPETREEKAMTRTCLSLLGFVVPVLAHTADLMTLRLVPTATAQRFGAACLDGTVPSMYVRIRPEVRSHLRHVDLSRLQR